MNKSLAMAVMVLTMFGFGSEAVQKEKPADGETATLKVEGMACNVCASRVEKTALAIEGVKAAKVTQPKGIAEITFDPARTSAEAVASAISKQTPFKAETSKQGQKKR